MDYRDEVYFTSAVDPEPAFPPAEYAARLQRVRRAARGGRYRLPVPDLARGDGWISGYQCEWYQAQSPRQWPAASGIAVHVDHDRYILFDTEREAALGRIFTASTDTRYFPRTSLRGGAEFVVDELAALGWLDGTLGLELWSYRPNGPLSARFQALAAERGATIVDGTDVVRELRWVKSPLERAAMREAAADRRRRHARRPRRARARRDRARGVRRDGRRARAGGRREHRDHAAGPVRLEDERRARALHPARAARRASR